MTTMNRTVPCLGGMAILLCCLGAACGAPSMDSSLPVYTIEQTDSAHPGYRRTIVSTAGASYVNDFEEQSLQTGRRSQSIRERKDLCDRRPGSVSVSLGRCWLRDAGL